MKIPAVGESITEVAISEWLKEDGAYVEMDEVIAEIESDKATFELTAEAAGTLQIVAQPGDTLEIGALACKIAVGEKTATEASSKSESESTGKPAEKSASEAATPSSGQTYATGHASPAAAKILAEKGIDPKDVQGSGRDGRITKEDATEAKKSTPQPSKSADTTQEKPTSEETAPSVSGERQQRREKMSSLRKTISRRLVAAKNETAMLTTFNEVDMKPVMDLRKKYKGDVQGEVRSGTRFYVLLYQSRLSGVARVARRKRHAR